MGIPILVRRYATDALQYANVITICKPAAPSWHIAFLTPLLVNDHSEYINHNAKAGLIKLSSGIRDIWIFKVFDPNTTE